MSDPFCWVALTFVGVWNYLLCRAGSVVHHEPPSLPGHPARGVCSPHLHQLNQLDALQPTCSIWAGDFCESCSRRAHVSMPTSRRSASNTPAVAAADGLQLDDRLRRLSRPGGCILHSRLSFWDCLGPMRLPRRMDGSRTHGTFHRERISPFPACWAAGGTLAGSAQPMAVAVLSGDDTRAGYSEWGVNFVHGPARSTTRHPRAKWPPRHLLSTPPSLSLGAVRAWEGLRKHRSIARRPRELPSFSPQYHGAAVQEICLARPWATA